jgi:hypothetical protein
VNQEPSKRELERHNGSGIALGMILGMAGISFGAALEQRNEDAYQNMAGTGRISPLIVAAILVGLLVSVILLVATFILGR